MGTLIRPKTNVAVQYIEAIARHGSKGVTLSERDIWHQFYASYKHQSSISPVYGFYTQQDTYDWWKCVFRRTFEHEQSVADEHIDAAFDDVYHNFEYGLLPGAKELLESIKRDDKCKVAAYSNTDERIHVKLAQLGINEHFDWVMTSGETGLEKPRLQGYLRMLTIAGIPDEPEQAVHIGDDYHADYDGAKRAGLNALLMGSNPNVPSYLQMKSLNDVHNYLYRHQLTHSKPK